MSCVRKIRNRPLTWCHTPNWVRIGSESHCQLAASWQAVLDAAHMDSHSTFNEFYDHCVGWRTHLCRSFPGFADIEEVIGLSMWEHFSRGVTNERAMFRAVSVDVRRYVRHEARQTNLGRRLHYEATNHVETDPINDAINRLGIAQQLAKVGVPAKAQAWAEHALSDRPMPISDAERIAGRRWAVTASKALADA
jgi:hypothetical protein